ncbi:MAG: TPR repeat protein [Gammaproteobacteria bacterium]|jgi:TPR repeat protein
MIRSSALCLFMLLNCFHALASDSEDADLALMRGDYRSAISVLQKLADAGDPTAMVRLAALYHRGEGVSRDIEKAADLYLAAAELGNAEAQFNLGNMYLLGEGFPEDESWALTFYRLAAEQGHALATANMEEMIRAGLNLSTPNDSLPLASSAEEGQQELDLVETASEASEEKISTGSESTNHQAADTTTESSDFVSLPDKPVQVTVVSQSTFDTQSELESSELEQPAAAGAHDPEIDSHGSTESLSALLDIEATAPNGETSGATTSNLAMRPNTNLLDEERQSDSNFAVADSINDIPDSSEDETVVRANAVVILEVVEPVVQSLTSDEVGALKLAEKHGISVDLKTDSTTPIPASSEVIGDKHANANGALRERFENAQITLREDHERGLEALERLANDGNAESAMLLAEIVSRDGATEKSPDDAIAWLHRAAVLGNAEAQYRLGEQYMHGTQIIKDEAMAITFYRDAARSGHESANEKLNAIYTGAGLPVPDLSRAPQAIIPTKPAAGNALPGESAHGQGADVESPRPLVAAQVSDAEASVSDTRAEQVMHSETEFVETSRELDTSDTSSESVGESLGTAVVQEMSSSADAVEQRDVNRLTDATSDPDPMMETGLQTAVDLPSANIAEANVLSPLLSNSVPSDGTDSEVTARTPSTIEQSPSFDSAIVDHAIDPALMAAEKGLELTATGVAVTKQQGAALAALGGAAQIGIVPSREITGFDSQATTQTPGPDDESPEATRAIDQKPLPRKAEMEGEVPEVEIVGSLDDAKQALADRQFALAAQLFTQLANAGNAEAQAHLGYLYFRGEGVEKDIDVGIGWYRRAAVLGNRDAQYNLGVAHAFGEGVEQSDVEAVHWYRRAAEQGSPVAQFSLGMSYALGEGVTRDDEQSLKWYRAAAENGYAAAQYNLGYGYRTGNGTEQDDELALQWFLAAANNGHASAQYSLGYMYRSGRGAPRDIDEALKWYKLAAAQGHLDARADLASLNSGAP